MNVDWKINQGRTNVLLVASHNFPQIRNGEVKERDLFTGKMVDTLCEETGAWGIVSTAVQEDPNWYADSPFRTQVKKLIVDDHIDVVIDVHGRKDSLDLIEYYANGVFNNELLEDGKLKEFIKDNQLTLIEDLGQNGIAGVEVEVRKDGRIIGGQANEKVLGILKRLIMRLTK